MPRDPQDVRFVIGPLLVGVGVLYWLILLASLAMVALIIIAPAWNARQHAHRQANNLQATLRLANEKIALERRFLAMADTNPLLMQRLADRQLDLINPRQQVLPLNGRPRPRDVQSLVDEALVPVTPKPVASVPWWAAVTLAPFIRVPLMGLAMVGFALVFLLEIRRVKVRRG
jgi:hypothetical protein